MCTHPLVWTIIIVATYHLWKETEVSQGFRLQRYPYVSKALLMAETIQRRIIFTVISFDIFVAFGVGIQVFFLLLHASATGEPGPSMGGC